MLIINGKAYRDPTSEEERIIEGYEKEWSDEIAAIPESDPEKWPDNNGANKPYREATKRLPDRMISLLTT